MANYELWYLDDVGNRLAYIPDWADLEYVKVLGGTGSLSVTLPKRGQVYDQTLPDRRIAVYRQPTGGSLSLEIVALMRLMQTSTTAQGQDILTQRGEDFNELLTRRIVAYYAGSAQSQKTDLADDMMKEIVTQNLFTDADYSGGTPARDIAAQGFGVQSDLGAGPSLTKGFSWRNVMRVLQDLQAASKAAGTEVFFGMVPTSETAVEFRTWTTTIDRTVTTGVNPITFSMEWGNLINPLLQYDYTEEQNAIYAGGQGDGELRTIALKTDPARIGSSQLNRREGFGYSRGIIQATVDDDAQNELERRRPLITIQGTLLDTPLTPYGGVNGWNLGDKVTVNYASQQFDVIVKAARVRVAADGKETIDARIEDINA